jgi:hypothetical protein
MAMKTIGVRKRLAALGCIAVVAMICMAVSGGCGRDLHKAATASAGIAASLNTVATVNHNDPFESPAEKQAIASYILQVAQANDRFIGVLKVSETQGSAVNTATIETALSALVAQVNQLNAQGVLKLKSPQAQADFAIAISSIQASLAVIESIYPPVTARSALPLKHRAPLVPLFAVTLTAEEIEELIALVIAAGSALLPKLIALRGETDPQLLASAAADDAAAEAIAESDGAGRPIA